VTIARGTQSVVGPRTAARRGRLPVGTGAWQQLTAALLGFSVLVTIGVADGGVLPRSWRLATLALCAIAAAALVGRRRVAIGRLEAGVVAALAALAAWTALSGAWSGEPSVSLVQAERAAAYVALVLAVLLVAERSSVPHLLGGMVAGITLVAGIGLVEYVVSPPPLDPFEGRLLHRPLGYANALGIFAAIGALLAAGLGLRARRAATRRLALAPLVVLLPALYLTSSRGAWLAFAAGALLLVRLGHQVRRPVAAGLAVLACVAVAAVLVVSGGPGDLAGENRSEYWRVAWDQYLANPLLGDGAGTFGDYFLAHGSGAGFTRTAHSLYVQSLAELGPVGLLLVVLALALPLVRLRARRDPLLAAAGAAYVAYVLHTGVDWDWEMPATTFAGLLSGTAILVATRSDTGPGTSVRMRVALVVPVVALGAFAALRIGTGPGLPFAP
jgi:O-antigen ligase